MKKLLKAIVWLFEIIWNIFFGEKEKPAKAENTSAPMITFTNHPIVAKHNNRKVTDGRFVQYINMGQGRTRAIYHGAK